MRLGVLSRAVIVASCFWMLGGTFLIAMGIDDKATVAADAYYQDCVKNFGPQVNCWVGRQDVYHGHTIKIEGGLWGYAASMAAIYLALALVTLGAVYGAVRWVLAGRTGR